MDAVSDLSGGESEDGHRRPHIPDTRNSLHEQGSPFMQNYVSQKPPDESGLTSPRKTPIAIKGWPQGAQRIRKYRGWGYIALLVDVLVTFLPVIFLCL